MPTFVYCQQRLSLKDIPSLVKANLPALNAAKANAEASKSLVDFEKRSLMPDVSVAYQANMATFNNITGMSYPGLIMPISGPPSATNDINFVMGTAATAFLTWRPITFGQRNSAIQRAAAQYQLANADYNEQSFRYEFTAINAYMEAIYFRQIIASNRSNISRYRSNLEQSLVLAKNGLKPGIDTLQIQSSIAQAEIDLLQSENSYKQKLRELSSLIGGKGNQDIILVDSLFNNSPTFPDTSANISNHPFYRTATAQKEVTAAQLNEVNKSWRPKLDIWGNVYGRGSGVDAVGNINKSDGLNLTRTNIGAGIQLSFPLLQLYQVNAKKKQYEQLLKADEYRISQVELDLNKQVDMAMQQYESNLEVAKKTIIRLNSALEAYNSLKISYEVGLVDFTRLAQSQYELQQAELYHADAQIMLQRSLLDLSIAKGDLNLFFNR
jgi:outer membrane protein TolC